MKKRLMKLKTIRTNFLMWVFFLATLTAFGQAEKVEISGRGDMSYTHKTSNGVKSTDVDYRGTIVFNDTDTDVESISSGGFLKISQKTFGTRRTALLEGKSDGSIAREFKVGSKTMPWEPEGSEWLADVLLDVIRSSGIGAETRVNRFYKKGGVDALTDEIDEISSDYVKAIYYRHSVEIGGITTSQVNRLVEEAADDIGSDFELSRFFIEGSDVFVKDNSTLEVLLESTDEISSDFEQARVLKHYIKEHDLTDAQIEILLEAASEISSDFEHAGVLKALVNKVTLSDQALETMLESIDDISSDFEASGVLTATIKEQELTDKAISMVINASNYISSDFEQARVLKSLMNLDLSADNLMAIAHASENISSDFELGSVLTTLLSKNDFDNDALIIIVEASDGISSDFEQAKVLITVSKQGDLSDDSFEAVTEAVDDISSDFEKGRVLTSLINENNLTKAKALALISATEEISSNFEKSSVMQKMGPKVPDDSEVHSAFREVARTISSDHEYGRVMRSVDF